MKSEERRSKAKEAINITELLICQLNKEAAAMSKLKGRRITKAEVAAAARVGVYADIKIIQAPTRNIKEIESKVIVKR
jgi:hypothetical protein